MKQIEEMTDEELQEHLESFQNLLQDCETRVSHAETELFYKKNPECRPKE